jgi:hypothetical protein
MESSHPPIPIHQQDPVALSSLSAELVRVDHVVSDIHDDAMGFGLEFLDTTPVERMETHSRLWKFMVSTSPRDRASLN